MQFFFQQKSTKAQKNYITFISDIKKLYTFVASSPNLINTGDGGDFFLLQKKVIRLSKPYGLLLSQCNLSLATSGKIAFPCFINFLKNF